MLMLALPLCACRGCGARGGQAPARPNVITERDGVTRYQVDKGKIKAYYDQWGRLERLEEDSNGDGRRDRVSHHAGKKDPGLIEIDTDFDGRFDRWEQYDDTGHLVRVGASRSGGGPDIWEVLDAQGQILRRDYDDDHDGKIDRSEILEAGRVVRTEVDADRDGRVDRWQRWDRGHLTREELDTDADGRPDHVVLYGSDGKVIGMKRIAAR
jgi:hypothetical protein